MHHHSYFNPDLARLTAVAQVVYPDPRSHGLSEWGPPAEWSHEVCADDLHAFCEAVGVNRPVGELDAVTPVDVARKIAERLPEGAGRLHAVPGAGQLAWLDGPDLFWPILERFVEEAGVSREP